MKVFKIIIYVLAAICIITGANDFFNGVSGLRSLGANLSESGFSDPVADNVIRFFAGIWIGIGVLFIHMVQDLKRYKPVLLSLMAIVFLGGVGRILSIANLGMPSAPGASNMIIVGLIVEIGMMPVLSWWLYTKVKN